MPNPTTPNQITLNWTMCSQTKACIAISCEVFALVRYHAVQSDNSTATFQDNPFAPVSRVNKSKRENRVQGKFIDTVFCFGTSFSDFLKDTTCSGSQLGFCFQAKKHLTWWTP
jgi:hypothetical protein